jgi:curved DNA-binding protein CbpA
MQMQNAMNLAECYKILEVSFSATDEDIKKSFKNLAFKYHPDRNPGKAEWANKVMADLNLAYTSLMQMRFREKIQTADETKRTDVKPDPEPVRKDTKAKKQKVKGSYYNPYDRPKEYLDNETLTKAFVDIRESTKDILYKYFQYGIYNIARREEPANRSIYNNIAVKLKKSFHSINYLKDNTDDKDFIKHFEVFARMIYNFYMASECVNIIDSYNDNIEVYAYRMFRKGDDSLHPCEKEVFFDRHNRGFFKKNIAESLILQSELNFKKMLQTYPDSTWAVERRIKLQYTVCLKEYLYLFFSEYQNSNAI